MGFDYFIPNHLLVKIAMAILKSGSDSKASVYNVGDLGLIPGSGRSAGEENGKTIQPSCLENPMGRGA